MRNPRSKCWIRIQIAIWVFGCLILLAAEPAKEGSSLNNGAQVPLNTGSVEHASKADGHDTELVVESLWSRLRELTYTLEKARVQLKKMKADLLSLRMENKSLKSELETKIGAIKAVIESLAVSQTELEFFRRKYEVERLRLQTLGGQIKGDGVDFEKKFTDLLQVLEQLESERAQLRKQLKRTIEIAEALLPTSAEGPQGEKVRAMINSELTHAKEFVKEKLNTLGTSGTGEESSLQNAHVLRVNSELQLVVLDIGHIHGVQVGMPFAVIRDKRAIAQVMVVDVRERICGALIVAYEKTPESGDRARVEENR